MKLRKYVRKLTPSGYSDNGVWLLSDETVEFPTSKLNEAIVETVTLKKGTYGRDVRYFNAIKVTIDGNSWYVEEDPRHYV